LILTHVRLRFRVSIEAANNDPQTTSAEPRTGARLSDPETWVGLYGDYLFKFAMMRLRDATKAEDAVQETFLAALKSGKSFAGQSSEKSWLVGILKNKIYDHFRKSARETSFTDLQFYADEENEPFGAGALREGSWIHQEAPSEWQTAPGAGLDSEEFWKTFRSCSEKLPPNINTVFALREIDGLKGVEICSLLNISESNLWVMLHRARMALRRCLEINWFGKNLQ